jgi:hypothetical protein
MPTLDECHPTMVDGAAAKQWLRVKWDARKSPTKANQAFCCRCGRASPFLEGSVELRRHTAKALTWAGECSVCGMWMNKFASAESIAFFDPAVVRRRGDNAA